MPAVCYLPFTPTNTYCDIVNHWFIKPYCIVLLVDCLSRKSKWYWLGWVDPLTAVPHSGLTVYCKTRRTRAFIFLNIKLNFSQRRTVLRWKLPVSCLHELDGVVDLGQGHVVGDKLIQLHLLLQVLIHQLGHTILTLKTWCAHAHTHRHTFRNISHTLKYMHNVWQLIDRWHTSKQRSFPGAASYELNGSGSKIIHVSPSDQHTYSPSLNTRLQSTPLKRDRNR